MPAGRTTMWVCAGTATMSAVFLGAWQVGRGSPPTLAAALTFGGAVLTGAVALVGHLVTRQANQRLDEERVREDERLRLDAAMQAGTLLASPNQPAAAASGLLALSQLGQADLAVALLVDLWAADRNQLSTETAILVIDAALRSDKPNAQLVAAELLCRNAFRLNACQSLHWPSVIDGRWDPRFTPKTKFLLLEALLLMTTARAMDRNSLRSVAVRLYGIWSGDPDAHVRGCVATVIRELVPALSKVGYTDFMQGGEIVTLCQLRAAATSAAPNADQFLAQVVAVHSRRLAEWAAVSDDVPLGSPVAAASAVAR